MSGNPYFLLALFLLGVLSGALGVYIWLYRRFRFIEDAQRKLLCQIKKFAELRSLSRWSPAAQQTYQDILAELKAEPKTPRGGRNTDEKI